MRNLPESRRHAPVNSVIRNTTASMRSATVRGENAPHGALLLWRRANDQTIYNHTHPSTPKANRCPRMYPRSLGASRRHTGDPAVGAGSRWLSCGPVSGCADEDGSAGGGDGVGDAGGSLGTGGSGSGVRVGAGSVCVAEGAGRTEPPASPPPRPTRRLPPRRTPTARRTPCRPSPCPACRACRPSPSRRAPRNRPRRRTPRRVPRRPAHRRSATASRCRRRRPRPRSCSPRWRRRP